MTGKETAAVCCCRDAPTTQLSSVRALPARVLLPLSPPWFFFLYVCIFLSPTTTAASCLPPSHHPRGPWGTPRGPYPYACIGNPLTSLRDLWRGFWDRTDPRATQAHAPVNRAAAATQVYAGLFKAPAKVENRTAPKATAAADDTVPPLVGPSDAPAGAAAVPAAAAAAAAAEPAASETAEAKAAGADEVREAALWFKQQRDLWRRKTATKIRQQLGTILTAQEVERQEQNKHELQSRVRINTVLLLLLWFSTTWCTTATIQRNPDTVAGCVVRPLDLARIFI